MLFIRLFSAGLRTRCSIFSPPLIRPPARFVLIPLGLLVKRRLVYCQDSKMVGYKLVDSRGVYYGNTVETNGYYGTRTIFSLYFRIIRLIRIVLRLVQLFILYVPLFVVYPFMRRDERRLKKWYGWALYLAELGGPAIVKFMQWASTRRDLFSREFCDIFSRLHTSATPHRFKWTENALRSTLGPNWREYFLEFDDQCCGSGCVAQVHKATLNYVAINRAPSDVRELFETHYRPCVDVAVKVVHPGVRRIIDDDLAILSGFARIIQWIIPVSRYVDPLKCVEEFSAALHRQIDMRYEGDSLRIFTQQFKDDSNIRFPRPLLQTEDVLIETFEEGERIANYLTSDDVEMKRKLASMGIEALLKMVFVHNFVHGDLHPGNILVQHYSYTKPRNGIFTKLGDAISGLMKRDGSNVVYSDDNAVVERRLRLVFLDAGISFQLGDRDLANLRALFKEIVNGNGTKVGELLLQNAPQQRCADPDAFKTEVDKLVTKARSATVSLGNIDVSNLMYDLLSTVSHHRVNLEPNFTCVVLAVLVLEGLGRSLNQRMDLIQEARPILMRV